MLWQDAAFSFLHFVFAFILVGALAAELFILRLPIDGRVARLLLRVDAFYGIAAVGVILAGIARIVWGAKGWDFYQTQHAFWGKIAVFAIIGLISIAPTRTFIRWVRSAGADASFSVAETDAKKVRRLVMIEVHLLVLIPLFAALMARGIGA